MEYPNRPALELPPPSLSHTPSSSACPIWAPGAGKTLSTDQKPTYMQSQEKKPRLISLGPPPPQDSNLGPHPPSKISSSGTASTVSTLVKSMQIHSSQVRQPRDIFTSTPLVKHWDISLSFIEYSLPLRPIHVARL